MKSSINTMSHTLFVFFLLPTSLLCYITCTPLLEDGKTLSSLTKTLHSPLSVFDTWNVSNPSSVCSWVGISCDGHRVAAIDLSNLNISGSVELAGLDSLVNLSLAGNQLNGFLTLSKFPNLRYLNISGNHFSGNLEMDYSGTPNLEVFDAYDNNFTAPLPLGVTNLQRLRYLDLGGNFFYGKIPASYGNMVAMESLSLTGNDLRGRIPGELGNLTKLNYLYLGYFNAFEGGLPAELGKLGDLVHLDISSCGIDGLIPDQLGYLINLDTLYLHTNALSGEIPAALGNLTRLGYLDLSNNALTGEIPREFARLTKLSLFNLFMNRLHGSIPEFMAGLPELETLELFMNNFTGVIPKKLGSGGKLQVLDISSNKLTGTIPEELCPSNQLKILILFKNFLFGPLPESLGECLSLTRVRLAQNYFNGSVPLGLIYLPHLDLLELHNNYLSGMISENPDPERRRESRLTVLNLSNNILSGPIPASISNLSILETLIISSNLLSGEIPLNIGLLQRAEKIDFSRNQLSGYIPPQIGQCALLTYLDLSRNNLSGRIPLQIASLTVLSYLNLSRNHLSDSIPSSIGSISSLTAADFSFNDLSGRLIDSGQLAFLNASAFAGNPRLCGAAISNPCIHSAAAPAPSPHLRRFPADFKLIFAVGLLICFLFFAAAAASKVRTHRRTAAAAPWKMTAFQKVGFGVTEVVESMKEGNEIGRGGAGVVYLGRSPAGDAIAVKKLLGFGTNGHDHGFRAEIRTLGRIRHRNIVRLLAFCSDSHTNVLVYEYMSNGSLGEVLHGKRGGFLKWDRRYRIALESARGLCYLHHDCCPMIIHRDVKANNILLDSNLEAHVADFGLARFLPDGTASECMSAVAGSYGYIAPEYAYTLKVDEKSDVYSFGVVLLELITGRRPVGDFGDGVDIVQWVRKTTNGGKQNVNTILDSRLGSVPVEEAMHVFFIAVLCVQENSVERPTMREVVQMLSEFSRHVCTEEMISATSSCSKQLQKTEQAEQSRTQSSSCYKLFPDLLS